MRPLFTFAWSVLIDALHRKVFYAILAFTLILVLLIPLLPSAGVGIQIDLMREAALGLTSIMAFLLAVILASSIIPGEMGRKTIYNTLSKPVRRWEYYLGKYLGVMLVVTVTLLLTDLVIVVFVLAKFGVFNPGLSKAVFTIWLEAGVLAAVAMAASVYLNPLICVFLAGLFYVVCHVKGDFLYRAMTDAGNNIVFRGLAAIPYYILPNLEKLNINEAVAHGERAYEAGAVELLLLAGMAVVFTMIFLYLGWWIFSRRDL